MLRASVALLCVALVSAGAPTNTIHRSSASNEISSLKRLSVLRLRGGADSLTEKATGIVFPGTLQVAGRALQVR
jgi:hypothetical protein